MTDEVMGLDGHWSSKSIFGQTECKKWGVVVFKHNSITLFFAYLIFMVQVLEFKL